MAEQNIRFKLGSDFNDGGFQKATKAITGINSTAKSGMRAAAEMAAAYGGLDKQVAGASKAITGLMSALTMGNPIIAGVTLAVSALCWGFEQLKIKEEEAKKKAEELRQNQEKLLVTFNTGIFNKATKEATELGLQFERIAKHANEMTAAINTLNNSKGQTGILQLEADKIVAVFNQVSEEGRQVVAAEYDLQIATAKATQMRIEAEQKVQVAHDAVATQEGRLDTLLQERQKLEQALTTMKNNNLAVEKAEKSVRESVLKQIKEMEDKINAVDAKILDGKNTLEVLLVKENTTKEQLIQAQIKGTALETESQQKQDELKQAIEDRRIAEEQAALDAQIANDKAEALALEQQNLKDCLADEKSSQERVNKSAKELDIAQKNLKAAMDNYKANYQNNKNNEAVFNSKADGMGQLNIDWSSVSKDIVNEQLQQCIESGQAPTVKELDRIQRQLERQQRDEVNRYKGQLSREKQRYDQLLNKNPKTWSKQDKDFYNKFNQIAKKGTGGASAVADAQTAYEQALQNWKDAQEQASNIKAIKDLLCGS